MTCLLILDPDPHHAQGLSRSLQTTTREVTVCCDLAGTLRALANARFDILILAIADAQELRRAIDTIQNAIGNKSDSPPVICLSRTYCGPRDRLEAERRGVRLVYER